MEAGAVRSVVKVLDILEHLGGAGRPVSLSDVARATGFNVSTTHRLLQTLAHRGYVEQRSDTRGYALGPRLVDLGSAYVAGQDLVGVARPHLEALRDAVGETVHLAVYDGGDILEICHAAGQQVVSVSFRTGRRDPAHCTALGKALLAFLPEPELATFFARGDMEKRTRHTITDKAALRAALERVRADGYALDEEELADDLCCLGMPLRDSRRRVVAALSIAMPKARFRVDRVSEWVGRMNEMAGRISRGLGLIGD